MPGTTLFASLAESAPSRRRAVRPSAGAIFLPKEHGSWSLALEPLALGLLVAPSSGGAALAVASLAGFFARRPLKAAFPAEAADHRRPAGFALALLAILALAGLVEAGLIGGPAALWPLLVVAPLGGLFVYFDSQNGARAAAAELVGCAAFAFLPAALATLAGWSAPAALALAALALARSLPTVLTVRTYLRLEKHQRPRVAAAVLPALLAGGGVALLAAHQLVPWVAAALTALLLVRTGWLVSALRPAVPAKRIGLLEAILGALYLTALTLAYHGR